MQLSEEPPYGVAFCVTGVMVARLRGSLGCCVGVPRLLHLSHRLPRGTEMIECQFCHNEVRTDRVVVWGGTFTTCEGHTRTEMARDDVGELITAR